MTANTTKTEENTTYRGPTELFERMNQFVEQATPALREKMAAATLATNGKARGPKASNVLRFLDYAIDLALNLKEEAKTASPRMGVRIDKDVQELMKQNLDAFNNYPVEEREWRLIGIGPTLLRTKGHNPETLVKWLKIHQKMLDDHHAEIGITDLMAHNRKRGKTLKKMGLL